MYVPLLGIIGGEICNSYVQKTHRKTRDYRKNTGMLSSMLLINGPVVNSFVLNGNTLMSISWFPTIFCDIWKVPVILYGNTFMPNLMISHNILWYLKISSDLIILLQQSHDLKWDWMIWSSMIPWCTQISNVVSLRSSHEI